MATQELVTATDVERRFTLVERAAVLETAQGCIDILLGAFAGRYFGSDTEDVARTANRAADEIRARFHVPSYARRS